MAIHAISGAPGGGKTSLAMELLAAEIEKNLQAVKDGRPALVVTHPNGEVVEYAKRPLYVANVDGLVESPEYQVMPDASLWNEVAEGDTCDCLNGTHQVLVREGLRPDGSESESVRFREELGRRRWHGHKYPDGAWFLIDEAWAQFGHLNDARGRAPPLHVQALAEHRHRAVDFVWTFQGPPQMYPFLRPLLAPHWHTVSRFGQFIDVYKWGEFVEEVKSQGMRDRGVKDSRRLPTKQRTWWRSATAHTGRPKFPRKMLLAGIGAVIGLGLLAVGIQRMRPSEMVKAPGLEAPEGRLRPDGAKADGPHARSDAPEDFTPETWAARFKPLIPGVHGSEPVFNGRTVASVPRTFCVIGAAWEGKPETCICRTEQATPVYDVRPEQCRFWALNGIYDYFRAPDDSTASVGPTGPTGTAVKALEPEPVLGPSFDVGRPPLPPAKPGVLNPNMRALDATPPAT